MGKVDIRAMVACTLQRVAGDKRFICQTAAQVLFSVECSYFLILLVILVISNGCDYMQLKGIVCICIIPTISNVHV